jgi:hypothetical protein
MTHGTRNDTIGGSNRKIIHSDREVILSSILTIKEIHQEVLLCQLRNEGEIWIVEHFI